MNYLKLAMVGFFTYSTLGLAQPEITCKSIDVTFRPFYVVEIQVFDVTHPGYYAVKITKTVNLAGTKKQVLRKEGSGKISDKKFFVDFSDDQGRIEGKRLSNGILKADLELDGEVAELVCKDESEE